MKIEAATNGDTVILFPEGWIDSTNAAELERAVDAYVDDCEKMILDFSGIDYISSAGLRVIVGAHRQMESKQQTMFLLWAYYGKYGAWRP